MSNKPHDPVNHPKHYTTHPSGVECIQVTEHMTFCLGNAVKYIWRAGQKGDAIEDLKKARWYIEREIERIGKSSKPKQQGIPDWIYDNIEAVHEYIKAEQGNSVPK